MTSPTSMLTPSGLPKPTTSNQTSTSTPPSTTPTNKPTIKITTSTPETAKSYATKSVPLFTHAFRTDPMFTYPLQHIPWYDRQSALYRLFSVNASVILDAGATIWESHVVAEEDTTNPSTNSPSLSSDSSSNTHHCIAWIVAPGQKTLDSLTLPTWIRLLRANFSTLLGLLHRTGIGRFISSADEYYAACKKAKEATFAKDEEYYYVSHIATDEKYRGKGLAPALLREVLKMAQKEGRPVWLESSSMASRKVYLKVGFRDVAGEEGLKTGVGKADGDGEKAVGKEAVGVTFWPMVWWPEGYKRGKKIGDGLE